MSGVNTPVVLAFEVAAPRVEWAEKVDTSIPKAAIVPFSHLPMHRVSQGRGFSWPWWKPIVPPSDWKLPWSPFILFERLDWAKLGDPLCRRPFVVQMDSILKCLAIVCWFRLLGLMTGLHNLSNLFTKNMGLMKYALASLTPSQWLAWLPTSLAFHLKLGMTACSRKPEGKACAGRHRRTPVCNRRSLPESKYPEYLLPAFREELQLTSYWCVCLPTCYSQVHADAHGLEFVGR